MTPTQAHPVRNLIIGTSLILFSSSNPCFAQSQASPLEPTLENARGTWELDLSIRKSRIAPRNYIISAENLTSDLPSQAESVKGWSIRTAKLLRDMAKKGGQKASDFTESFRLVVQSRRDFFIEQRSFGGHTGRHERAETEQRLYRSGFRARRTDNPRGEGQDFTLHNPKGTYAKCFFITEWRMHANLVNYCRILGEDAGNGVRSIPVQTLRREPPAGVPLFRHEHHLMMRGETVGAGQRFTTSIFDKRGRVSREWQSVWIDGRPVRLKSKILLPGTQTVSSDREVKVKNRSSETALPTFAELAAIPNDRTACTDKRGDMDGAFDPRKGIPAKPHTMADYKARRDAERASEIDTTIHPRTVDVTSEMTVAVSDEDEAVDAGGLPDRLEALPDDSNRMGTTLIVCLLALLSLMTLLVVRTRRGPRPVDARVARRSSRAGAAAVSVLLVALGLLCSSCGTATTAEPHSATTISGEVEMTPPRINVPKADSRTPRRQQLELALTSNLGYEAEIVRTVSSCGCLQLRIPKKTIDPFGTVPVKAEFVTGRLSRVLVQVHWRCRGKTGICEARVVQSSE